MGKRESGRYWIRFNSARRVMVVAKYDAGTDSWDWLGAPVDPTGFTVVKPR